MQQTALAFPVTMTAERLALLEGQVRSALASYQEAGAALIEIRDTQAFKLRGHRTFEDYCVKEFGASDRHARRLIEGAETAGKVQAVLGEAPRNEGVARELNKIADNPVVLQKVADRLEKKKTPLRQATAEKVAEAVAHVIGKPRPEPAAARPAAAPRTPELALPVLSDICPVHQTTPAAYTRQVDGWHCGECGAPVVVHVVAAKPAECPHCAAAVQVGEAFCSTCGGGL